MFNKRNKEYIKFNEGILKIISNKFSWFSCLTLISWTELNGILNEMQSFLAWIENAGVE